MHKITVLLVLFCTTCHVALAIGDGLLRNGNFEHGPKASQMKGTLVTDRNAIPEWEISGFVEYIKSGRTCAQDQKLNVSVVPDFDSDAGVLPIQTMYSSNGWDSYAWAFKATSDSAEIIIQNPELEEDPACGPIIDNIAIKFLNNLKPTNKNLMKNGNFEEGPYVDPKASWGVLLPPNADDDESPLPGWVVESLKAVKYIDSDYFSVPQGRRAVELVAGKESVIAQVVRTIPGKQYALTFSVGDANNACEGSMIVEAFAGKHTIKVPYESKGKGGFKRAQLRFIASSKRTHIMFYSTYYVMKTDASLCGPVIDEVKLLSIRSCPSP